MTATITMDEAGQIILPMAARRAFGAGPGVSFQAEVTEGRIQVVKDEDIPEITEGVMVNGMLLLPKFGIRMDAAAAVRAERDELAGRAGRR